MLLKRLTEYAATQPEAAPFHRERRFLWQLELDGDGRARSTTLTPLVEPDATGKQRGVPHRTPAAVRTAGVAANLAADDVQYVLGWPDAASKPGRVAQCHTAFVDLIQRWAASPAAAHDPIPAALAAFYRTGGVAALTPPEAFTAKDGVVILVGGTHAHQAPSAPAFWAEEVARRKGSARHGQCLVCGELRPLLDTVPGKIPQRLVPGASNDAALVSVNAAVFGYDLTTQLAATPLCLECGEAVTSGLHALLDSPTNTTTAPGQDSKLAWWVVGGSDRPVRLLFAPKPRDVVELLRSVHRGRKPVPGKKLDERFHSVTVGGNIARIVVRDWVEMPLAAVEDNVARWFDEHEITSRSGDQYHSIGRLALVTGRWQGAPGAYTAFAEKGDGRPKGIYRDLMRAALRGTPLPRAVLTHVVGRIRADRRVDDARVALLRLALTRTPNSSQEKPMPGLDPDSTDPAYVAGRLFAAYEKLQYDAHHPSAKDKKRPKDNLNVTFADRYLAGAIANPRIALLNGARDARAWLRKLRRSNGGLATNNEKSILELHDRLDREGGYPSRLTPEEQARFVIGYHHQRAHQFVGGGTRDTPDTTNADTDTGKNDAAAEPAAPESVDPALIEETPVP